MLGKRSTLVLHSRPYIFIFKLMKYFACLKLCIYILMYIMSTQFIFQTQLFLLCSLEIICLLSNSDTMKQIVTSYLLSLVICTNFFLLQYPPSILPVFSQFMFENSIDLTLKRWHNMCPMSGSSF
jgi:hypothetical protein